MTVERLFVGNDMVLQLTLTDRDEVPITAATVQATELVDRAGNTPAGITLPLSLSHTADGVYEASIDSGLDVEEGDVLTAKIEVTSGSLNGEWVQTMKAVRRRA